jgi:nucleosome assembly protein 1-like 1
MAEHAETTQKKYPFDEEDIKYEKEIVDAIKKLPIDQRFQAIALNNYILMRKQLDVEVEGQIQEIVKKYNKLQAPLMHALNEIIAGKRAPTEEEFQAVKEHLNEEELGKIAESVNSEPIPDYWFKVLTTCAKLKEDIFETDHPLLKAITQIEQIPEDEGENFTIRFHFAPNEYFENEQLSVRFVMVDENDVAKTEGTEIKWKEGKDITKKTVTKKQKNKKTGKTRTVTKTVDADSFFNFFKSIDPKEEEGDEEEADDDDVQRLGINYDIATTLQEEIISYHLEYYLGLRTGDEDDEDDELEGIDEEDEDDDEDEEEGGHRHSKKCAHGHGHGKPKGGDKKEGAEGAGAGQKQECKQQ